MGKINSILVSMTVLTLVLSGCDEIIEPNISKEVVGLVAPAAGDTSRSTVQTFRWNALRGTRSYRISVAFPSFEKPSRIYVDSITPATRLTVTLDAGKNYQWRVLGLNNGYVTDSSQIRNLRIDSSRSLGDHQQVLLLKPLNNAVYNVLSTTFQWEPLPGAEQYLFKIVSSPPFDTVINAPVTQFTRRMPAGDRTYQWKIIALKWSTPASLKESPVSTFGIDTTPPATPSLESPAADATFQTLPVTLQWRRSGAASEIAHDQVFLYTSDQNSLVPGYPRTVTGQFVAIPNLESGIYYWAVRSVDPAGNVSMLSPKRKFTY